MFLNSVFSTLLQKFSCNKKWRKLLCFRILASSWKHSWDFQHFFTFIYLFIEGSMHMPQHGMQNSEDNFWTQFPPSSIWALGIELRLSSGKAKSTLTLWTISPAWVLQHFCFKAWVLLPAANNFNGCTSLPVYFQKKNVWELDFKPLTII